MHELLLAHPKCGLKTLMLPNYSTAALLVTCKVKARDEEISRHDASKLILIARMSCPSCFRVSIFFLALREAFPKFTIHALITMAPQLFHLRS